jgi:hypothetical protein
MQEPAHRSLAPDLAEWPDIGFALDCSVSEARLLQPRGGSPLSQFGTPCSEIRTRTVFSRLVSLLV